jgi:hypothetical protein
LALHVTLVTLPPGLLRTFLVFTAPREFLYSTPAGTPPKKGEMQVEYVHGAVPEGPATTNGFLGSARAISLELLSRWLQCLVATLPASIYATFGDVGDHDR